MSIKSQCKYIRTQINEELKDKPTKEGAYGVVTLFADGTSVRVVKH